MRIVSYGPHNAERAGILLDRGIVDLAAALDSAGEAPTSELIRLLERPQWRAVLAAVTTSGRLKQ
jgi:hypothetical protein